MRKPEQMSLIMSIVERGSGSKLVKLYNEQQVFTHLRCEGAGTATSEIMDILGLGSSEKDILLSFTPLSTARALLDAADYVTEMKLVKHPFQRGVPAREGIEY